MVEIAISLAIIGIALVAIIGVLPAGMRIQRANREQTVINADATVFLEAIRGGARGLDDLTNYVFMITNTYTGVPSVPRAYANFTSGAEIVGLLSTPEFEDANYQPTIAANAVYSNHMVAYVYSINGPAVEKPPQPNGSLIRQSSFSYGLICQNLPVAHYMPPIWSAGVSYTNGFTVAYVLNGVMTYWAANATTTAGDQPGVASDWSPALYPQELDINTHELRLTFLWPLLPNSRPPLAYYGPGHYTWRTMVAGQLALDTNTVPGVDLYFFGSQTFTNQP